MRMENAKSYGALKSLLIMHRPTAQGCSTKKEKKKRQRERITMKTKKRERKTYKPIEEGKESPPLEQRWTAGVQTETIGMYVDTLPLPSIYKYIPIHIEQVGLCCWCIETYIQMKISADTPDKQVVADSHRTGVLPSSPRILLFLSLLALSLFLSSSLSLMGVLDTHRDSLLYS